MTMTILKRSLTATAVAALLLAPALAQSPTATSPSTGMTAAPSAAGSPGFIAAQATDQWLASRNLIGAKVTGPTNETVGSINDLVVDRDGAILAAVVGVGGFLHIGEKNVAVPFKSLELTRSGDVEKISMRFTKDELQQAPAFKPLAPTPPAVTTAPGMPPRPRTPATQ
jgi:PRC-barrel domain